MSPLVTGYLLVTVVVAVRSCIARQRLSRNFALYNLGNAMVCILLDHSVSADDWSYTFAFMDVFAGCVALLIGGPRRCGWVATLGLIYLAQCGLHIAHAGELIGEHSIYRPGLNALFVAAQAVLCWGIATPPRRPRGYSVR